MRQRVLLVMVSAIGLSAPGCHGGKGETVEPTPKPDEPVAAGEAVACDQEIALECPDGMSDGCTRQDAAGGALTSYHVCLPADEQASQPCEQEIARECNDGLTDACLLDPPVAATHLCVQAAAMADEPTQPDEPTPTPTPDGSTEPDDQPDDADEG